MGEPLWEVRRDLDRERADFEGFACGLDLDRALRDLDRDRLFEEERSRFLRDDDRSFRRDEERLLVLPERNISLARRSSASAFFLAASFAFAFSTSSALALAFAASAAAVAATSFLAAALLVSVTDLIFSFTATRRLVASL